MLQYLTIISVNRVTELFAEWQIDYAQIADVYTVFKLYWAGIEHFVVW